MSDDKELNELIESLIERGPPYNDTERVLLAVFGPRAPDWEGASIPNPKVFRRFFEAVEVSKKLFGNSSQFDIMMHEPEPFQDFCGMSVYVKADDPYVVYAGFQDEDSVKTFCELAELVDSIMFDADISVTGEPILCLSWYINDPFLGKDS